jgi:hypothetical protein
MESVEESQEMNHVYTLEEILPDTDIINEKMKHSYTLAHVVEELKCINKKLDTIDKKLHTERDSLIELLRDIVTTGLRNTNTNTPRDDNKQENIEPDLYYIIVEDDVFIKGKKTYQNKDKIKTSFNGTWNKEKTAWSFKKFDNFEEKLKEEFPDITEGQL